MSSLDSPVSGQSTRVLIGFPYTWSHARHRARQAAGRHHTLTTDRTQAGSDYNCYQSCTSTTLINAPTLSDHHTQGHSSHHVVRCVAPFSHITRPLPSPRHANRRCDASQAAPWAQPAQRLGQGPRTFCHHSLKLSSKATARSRTVHCDAIATRSRLTTRSVASLWP